MSFNLKSWFRKSIEDEQLRQYDPLAHALTIIDENHRMIHDGFYYEVAQSDAALAAAAVVDLLLEVPAGAFPHFQELEVSTNGAPIAFDFFEGTSVSANGAELTVVNKNRNSSNTPEMNVYVGPTVTGTGTLLKSSQVPVAEAGLLFSQNRGGEWILAPSTLYLVRITNNSGAVVSINVSIGFYELAYPEDGTAIEQPAQQ